MYSMVTIVNNIVYLRTAQRVSLKKLSQEKNNLLLCQAMDVN